MSKYEALERKCTQQAATALVGRRIARVRYMSTTEAAESLWQNRPLIIELDDGTLIHAACDEEGNDAGVMFVDTKTDSLTFGRLP
jgi:hypothetical protein